MMKTHSTACSSLSMWTTNRRRVVQATLVSEQGSGRGRQPALGSCGQAIPIKHDGIMKEVDENQPRHRRQNCAGCKPACSRNGWPMKYLRRLIGLAFWCGLLGVLGAATFGQGET